MLIFVDNKIRPGTVINNQVRLVDIVPTILELFNIKYRPNSFDGTSLVPILQGRGSRDLIGYSETFYPEEQTAATRGKFSHVKNKKALRLDNKYKIIFHLNSEMVELYDLENDPNELTNLIG